jgi:hypothetical protein
MIRCSTAHIADRSVDHRFSLYFGLNDDLKRAANKVKLPAAQARPGKRMPYFFTDPGCVELDEHVKAQNIFLQTRLPSRRVDKKQEDIDW